MVAQQHAGVCPKTGPRASFAQRLQPRKLAFRATSRPLIKIAVLNFGKAAWIRLELRGDFIPQRRERGTRARIG